MTPHQKAIEAAKHDAKAAVDQLIDAIGRIMLATLEEHQAQPTEQANTHWTASEEDLLRQHYPKGGSKAVQEAGVRRSRGSITEQAHRLKVRYDGIYTPEQDDLIRQYYPHGGVKGVREAGLTGLTSRQIHNRAHTLRVKRVKEQPKPATKTTGRALDRVLADLMAADRNDMPLDAQDLTPYDRRCLKELEGMNLAKNLGDGLWAPTLAAIAQHEGTAA